MSGAEVAALKRAVRDLPKHHTKSGIGIGRTIITVSRASVLALLKEAGDTDRAGGRG